MTDQAKAESILTSIREGFPAIAAELDGTNATAVEKVEQLRRCFAVVEMEREGL